MIIEVAAEAAPGAAFDAVSEAAQSFKIGAGFVKNELGETKAAVGNPETA